MSAGHYKGDDGVTYHLRPQAVLDIAASLPNCAQVVPPKSPPVFDELLAVSVANAELEHSPRRQQQPSGSSGALSGILSFLVSDPPSATGTELDGAGVARVDVYCRSGTVSTCRVIQIHPGSSPSLSSNSTAHSASNSASNPDSASHSASHSASIATSVAGVATSERDAAVNSQSGSTIVSRMGSSAGAFSNAASAATSTAASTSEPLLPQQQPKTQVRRVFRRKCTLEVLRRLLEQPPKLTEIDDDLAGRPENDDDLEQQRRQHAQQEFERQQRREESLRRQVVDGIYTLGSLLGKQQDSFPTSTSHQDAYDAQRDIQQKIDLADVGLAILMGEVEALEKHAGALEAEHRRQRERKKKRQSNLNGTPRKHGADTDGSDFDSSDDDETNYTSADDSSSRESEAKEIARALQGCEIEYSFPHELHDDLEDALLDRSFSSDDDSTSDDESSSDDDLESKASRLSRRRRSSLSRANGGGKDNQYHPTIVAIPTNGEGCITLRENGGFEIVGKIPQGLHKELFRPDGPLPQYIALGTRKRYFVSFENGHYAFSGPASLGKILNKAEDNAAFSVFSRKKKQTKVKQHEQKLAIASVAFGKNYNDFFIVRADGSWEANGDLPPGLEKLLNDRNDRGDLLWVAMGTDDEWCVKAKNGRVWWGSVSEEIDDALAELLLEESDDEGHREAKKRELKWIDFGLDDSYFLIHR